MDKKDYNLPSWQFQLFLSDIKQWLKNMLLLFAPTLLYILSQIQNWQTLDYTYIKFISIWVLIDLIKRFIIDNTK